MSLQDRQSAFQELSSRTSSTADAENVRFDLQKRIRFMKLQLAESQELINELEGEKVSMEAALKSQKDLVAQESAKCHQLGTEVMRIRETIAPAQAMLAEERSAKKVIQEELQKSDAHVRALLLKEIDHRRMMQEAEENCKKRIAAAIDDEELRGGQRLAEQKNVLKRQFEEDKNRLLEKNEILTSQLELLQSEKKSLMEFWDRERDVLLKEQLLENEKVQDKIRTKDTELDKLSELLQSKDESLRSKDAALEGFVAASKSQISAFKLKSDEQKSILQQTSAIAKTSIPEIRLLRKELLVQRQSCVQMFKSCQQDLGLLQSCMVDLAGKSRMQAALHSKLELMFEAAAIAACDASTLFAKSVLAQEH
jgi:hypothetical protein